MVNKETKTTIKRVVEIIYIIFQIIRKYFL